VAAASSTSTRASQRSPRSTRLLAHGAERVLPLPWSWALSPALQYTLYDGGARIAAIDESVAALRSSARQTLIEQSLARHAQRLARHRDARQRVR
jgi:hypothetical protein